MADLSKFATYSSKMTRFQRRFLSYRETGFFSKIITDYLENPHVLQEFYENLPSLAGLEKKIDQLQFSQNRTLLSEVLQQQYKKSGLAMDTKVQSNLELLRHSNTYTVVTGHQLNLFSGPLYILYKLISVLKLTDELKVKFHDKHFVPVYWMATEDHDIDEINHFTLFNNLLEFKTNYHGAAGRMVVEGMEPLIDQLKTLLGTGDHAEMLLQSIQEAYVPGRTLSDATRVWVNNFLGDLGLVVIDADDAALKRSFIDVMKDDLLNHSSFHHVNTTIQSLERLGYSSQVHPREINLFYLTERERKRIVQVGNKFSLVDGNKEFTADEIVRELNEHPENFSPNVVLRPMYQQTILPNIAYVGGPAEIAYWMEYLSAFRHYNISFPLLVLRNCMLIADPGSVEKMSKLGFSEGEFFLEEDQMIRRYLNRHASGDFDINRFAEQFAGVFESLNKEIESIDPTLVSSVESEKQKLSNSLKQIEQKITRALKRKNETEINQIRKMKEKLFPKGGLQERSETMLPFLLRYGKDFISMVYDQTVPITTSFSILSEVREERESSAGDVKN